MDAADPNPAPPPVPPELDAAAVAAVLEHVAVSIWLVAVEPDGGFRFLWFNPCAERRTGLTNDWIRGRRPEDLAGRVNPAAIDNLLARYRECVESGRAQEYEEMVEIDGRRHVWLTRVTPLRDEAGRVTRLIGSGFEVTERRLAEEEHRRLEERLRQAQKMDSIGTLAGGIAHDFNNLLTGILGGAGLARMQLPAGSPALDQLRIVEESALRAATLTRQLLAYAGRGRLVLKPRSLVAIVRGAEELLRAAVPQPARLELDLDDEAPPVAADAQHVQQMLLNLVTNAAEAIGAEPGVVRVSVRAGDFGDGELAGPAGGPPLPAGAYVCLEVRDDGAGMDAATLARVFDPFFTTKFVGRGLGLPAALGIVRSHRGTILIDSKPGEGTVVRTYFPAVAASVPAEAPAAPPAPREQQGGAVLLVEDDPGVRRTCERVLVHHGTEVVAVADGLEALSAYRRHHARLALVVLDLSLPGMDGGEVFRLMQGVDPAVPVLLMSGYPEEEIARHFHGAGFAGFLHKPFSVPELVARVRQHRRLPPGA